MSVDYIHEKLMTSVDILATSRGTLRQRLGYAYDQFSRLSNPDIGWLSDDHRQRFCDIMRRMTAKGNVTETLARMSAKEDRAIAEGLFSLFLAYAAVYPSRG